MPRLENLLAAQSLALVDRIQAAETGSSGGSMSGSERAALVTLLAHPMRPVQWLGDVLGLTSSGVTRLVDRLEAAGQVTRAAGADGRHRHLRLTRAGRAEARSVLRAREAVVAAVVGGLSARERDQLERVLDKIVNGLASTQLPALQVCRLCDRAACAAGGRACPLDHTVGVQETGG